ncbi:MAG: tetratricopeptide repeat protein [Acidobacteria bacterium]|nr:tetratricopeptide repeat protein [Acidobacteriota bacterium]
MNETINWWPAIITAFLAVAAGIVLVVRSRRLTPAQSGEAARLRADANRVARSLQEQVDLGREPEERARLETELASLLGQLEALPDESEPIEEEPARPKPQLLSFATGVIVTLAVVGLAFATWQSMNPREEGEGLTGSIPETEMNQRTPESQLTALRMTVGSRPDDISARIALAEALMAQRDLVGVFEQTQEVLARQPEHPRALGLEAVVRMAMGQTGVAIEMLERSAALDPSDLETQIHLSIALVQTGQTERALAIIDEAMATHPGERAVLQQLRGEIERIGRETAPPQNP